MAESTPQQGPTLEQQVAQLKAENERLKAQGRGKLTPKVSQKGAVSVYGLGRWPVTLYREQWERLFEARETIEDFIADHADDLSTKS